MFDDCGAVGSINILEKDGNYLKKGERGNRLERLGHASSQSMTCPQLLRRSTQTRRAARCGRRSRGTLQQRSFTFLQHAINLSMWRQRSKSSAAARGRKPAPAATKCSPAPAASKISRLAGLNLRPFCSRFLPLILQASRSCSSAGLINDRHHAGRR